MGKRLLRDLRITRYLIYYSEFKVPREKLTRQLLDPRSFLNNSSKALCSRLKINGYQLCKSFLCAARASHHLKYLSFERASTTSHMDLQFTQYDSFSHVEVILSLYVPLKFSRHGYRELPRIALSRPQPGSQQHGSNKSISDHRRVMLQATGNLDYEDTSIALMTRRLPKLSNQSGREVIDLTCDSGDDKECKNSPSTDLVRSPNLTNKKAAE